MVKINFDIENEGFRDDDNRPDLWAIAATIEGIAEIIRQGLLYGEVFDVNGNVVGKFSVK